MRLVGKVLLVLGFCVGTLGAAGFHSPVESDASWEAWAWPFFAAGLVILVGGALLARRAGGAGAAQAGGRTTARESFRTRIEEVRDVVRRMDAEKETTGPEEMRARLGELLGGAYFDLTSRNDELVALLGFADYAKVWEGVATAERLLNRCWSMTTDGHYEEGREELPRARESLDQAAEALAALA